MTDQTTKLKLVEYQKEDDRVVVRDLNGTRIESFEMNLFCTKRGMDSIDKRISAMINAGVWGNTHFAQWRDFLFSGLPLAYWDHEELMICVRRKGELDWSVQCPRNALNTVEKANQLLWEWQAKPWWIVKHSIALAKVIRETRVDADFPSFAVLIIAVPQIVSSAKPSQKATRSKPRQIREANHTCPECNYKFHVATKDSDGKVIRCPECAEIVANNIH
jgi:hypothetical protein